VDLETLRQIESLATLSHRQLRQVGKHLVWRRYAPGNLILPHQVQLDLEGLVYRGQVQVATIQRGRRQVVGHIQAGEPIHRELWNRHPAPLELQAVAPTIVCLLPTNHQPTPFIPAHSASPARSFAASIHSAIAGTDRVLLGALLVSIVVLFMLSAWYWESPWSVFLSNLTYGLAGERLEANDEAQALALLRSSLDMNPHQARAYNDLGYIHYKQGRPQKAQVAFWQAVASDPALAVAQNNLGLSYLDQGQLDLAREALGQAVALNPESAEALLNLGVAEQRAGRPEEAIRAYRAALRVNPHLAVAQVNLGLLYYEGGLFAEAQRYLELALDAQPDMSRARVILGAIALSEGDRERAWRELERAAANLDDDPQLHFYLALWYEEVGLGKKAAQELDAVLALQPHPDLAALARSHLIVLESSDSTSQFSTDTKGE
jgi:tetratricopeptide (TPR) repeat protein